MMRRTAAKQTFYHGTRGKNLRGILKQGLRADPGHEEWTWDQYGDSVTFGGTYLTVNLKDAISHTGGDADKVLVITQLETRTSHIVPDEDVMLHIAIAAHHLRQLLPEYIDYHRTFKPELLEDIGSGKVDLSDYLEKWITLVSQSDEWRQMQFDPRLLLRYPEELLELMALAAEHSTKESEQGVRDYAEILNGLVKKIHRLTDPYDDLSVRSLKDIGYRGANRITAVLYYKIIKSGGVFSPYDLMGKVAYGNPEEPTVQEAIRTISLEAGGTTPPRVAVWKDQKGNIVYEESPQRRQVASVVKTASKLNMYHGTCTGPDGQILHSILKEGLKPDPKEKAYKSPYPDEDEDDYDGVDFETEITMRLDEAVGGAYLTNSIDEAKRYAQNACGQHGGNPVLVSAQVETRSPDVRIDEDFMINYVWEFVKSDFEPEDDDRYYRELFSWLESDKPNWKEIAKKWITRQFPQAKISDHRWKQILPAAGQMIQDVMVITFLQNHEDDANSESQFDEDDYWEVDTYYELSDRTESFKDNIAFVTNKLKEVTDPPNLGQHNVRVLKNVGYRGANRVLAVISWKHQGGYNLLGSSVEPGQYTQVGKVYYARSRQDAQDLLNASGVVAKYSKWTWRGEVLHNERVPHEQLKLPNVAHVVVAGRVYRQAAPDSYLEAEVFAGDQHLGFIVAKNEKLLQEEAKRLYQWSKEDFAQWSPDEEFGALRVKSSPFRASALEGVVDELAGNQYRDDNNRKYLDQALTELEEKGVWQA